MKSTIKWITLAGTVLALGTSPAVVAAQGTGATGKLSPTEVVEKVKAAGYTNIHDVEFDDGRWELEATSPAGEAVDLEVDPDTGKIVHEEKD